MGEAKSWLPKEPTVGGHNYPAFVAECRVLEKRFRKHADNVRRAPKVKRRRKGDDQNAAGDYFQTYALADYLMYLSLSIEALIWQDMIRKGEIDPGPPYRYKPSHRSDS